MKIEIENSFITDNSNECQSGCFFLKIHSNAKFWQEAEKKGAKLITLNEAKELLGIDENIKIIGVSGTNGKTTTATAIYEIAQNLGFKVFLAGTRGAFLGAKQIDKKGLTTSCVIKILEYLYEASKFGCEYFVMEVSSHAIDQNRIEGLKFALKIFTNLSQDHLDYHKTMQEYARVKSLFFADDTPKLINIDDNSITYNLTGAKTYAIEKNADFKVMKFDLSDGIKALVTTPSGEFNLNSNLQGKFNLYNLLGAIAAITMLCNSKIHDIQEAVSKFQGVEGRVEVVSKNPLVIVDFAHTPDGIQKVLESLKSKELIVVFGAGGDRDPLKRPIMGAIAQKYAQICIVTSDNPRSEEPLEIIEQILKGMEKTEDVYAIADRKEAIKLAISLATNSHIVAILGKGDEDYQEIKGCKYHFSDKEVVREILCK